MQPNQIIQPNTTPQQPEVPQEIHTSPVPQQPSNTPLQPKDTKKKVFFIFGAIVLVVLIVIGAYFALGSSDSTSKKQATNTTSSNTPATNFRYMDYESAYDGFRQRGINEFRTDKKQSTVAALKELTEGFVFTTQEKGTDTAKQLTALGAAYLYSEKKVDKEVSRYKLYMLFQDDLVTAPAGIIDENAKMPDSAQAKKIYEKYQDKNLSEQLSKTIDSIKLEDMAKQILKITDDQVAEYQIYAMNFDSKTEQEKKFMDDMKFSGWMPSIWTQSYTDARFVGFTKKYAQEFINSTDETSQAYFLHEFSHTQSPLNKGGLGVLPEERKAEEISGNKGTYFDVKQFFIYLNVFTGYDALASLASNPTNAESVYVDLYKNVGVEIGDSVIASFPVVYIEGANTPVKTVSKRHNLNSTLQLAIASGKAKDQGGQKKRLQERADKLITVLGTKEKALNDVNTNLSVTYQMPAAAEQIAPYLK